MSNSILITGKVIEPIPHGNFKIELDDGSMVLAKLSEPMRNRCIRILPGDIVEIETPSYNFNKGEIIYNFTRL